MGRKTFSTDSIASAVDTWRHHRSDLHYNPEASVPALVDAAVHQFESVGYSEEHALAIVAQHLSGTEYNAIREKANDLLHGLQHGLHNEYAFNEAINMMRSKGATAEGAFQYAHSLMPKTIKNMQEVMVFSQDAVSGLVAIAYAADPRVVREIARYEQPLFSRNVITFDETSEKVKVEQGFDPNAWGTPYKPNIVGQSFYESETNDQ